MPEFETTYRVLRRRGELPGRRAVRIGDPDVAAAEVDDRVRGGGGRRDG